MTTEATEPLTDAPAGPAVLLTDSAAAKVKELITAEGDPSMALRLAVRPGGCSGFQYDMYFDSTVDSTDSVHEINGVRLAVDAESAAMIPGASIDYKEMGLQGSGFAINNPNQQRSCGCGQSFC
ncbi:MAG: iron-sulfur cluster assembly accessory protein [Acidimicrobiia bacterium]|jgi:iron-sulfur cluster assembly protein/iron-sulfur cluster insertion protein|nr:iron-sulfur cluster assembly accessory protein [Acidimicrobiia bacterium]MBT8213942.1 iron-sulfur cluster assembly accessory protein [Acidimicrobiia bacterium]NNF69632.1 iron-sulfur cluster assembly accessory protein [Acidimicrobiia bacterium]NNK91618.1 iron-sulfur cluster assembly accessory protein [Acidimicrobiia bacterium]